MRPIETGQWAGAAGVLARAFFDDPGFGYIFPDPVARPRQLAWLYGRVVRMLAPLGGTYVLTAGEAGRGELPAETVLAAACWVPAGRHVGPLDLVRAGLAEAPFRVGLRPTARIVEVLGYSERTERELFASRPHWFLDHLGVDPDAQGRGHGRRALAEVLASRVDPAGLPALLFTAKERNVAFYRGSGFEVARETRFGDATRGFRFWAMVRPGR